MGLGLEGGGAFLYPASRMVLQRFNASVLGPLERPALAWMAAHMPARVTPDHLTLLGIFGALLAGAGYVLSCQSLPWLALASAGLLINWVGDSVDGTLARYRKIERPRYGFFVDHSSDLFGNVVVFLSLGVSPCAHFSIACLGLIAFLMCFVFTLIGAQVRSTMRITYLGFGPTEIRALLLLGNLMVLFNGVVSIHLPLWPFDLYGPLSTYDLGILILALAGALLVLIMALRESRALALEDPPRTSR
jgi:archaetidylinositol phosphate synthase